MDARERLAKIICREMGHTMAMGRYPCPRAYACLDELLACRDDQGVPEIVNLLVAMDALVPAYYVMDGGAKRPARDVVRIVRPEHRGEQTT